MRGLPAGLNGARHGEDEAGEEDRVTLSLAGLALALLLVVAGLFLVTHLRDKTVIEDCLLAGRVNCDAALAAR